MKIRFLITLSMSSGYVLNTPLESAVLHIHTSDTNHVTLLSQSPWDDEKGDNIISMSRLEFDVQKYLSSAIQTHNEGVKTIVSVSNAFIPFTFFTLDQRNNDIFVTWDGTGTPSKPVRIAPPSRLTEDVSSQWYDPSPTPGITPGTYTSQELLLMVNRILALHTNATDALYRMRDFRFAPYKEMWTGRNFTDDANFAEGSTNAGLMHQDTMYDVARNKFDTPTYYLNDGEGAPGNNYPGKVTFSFVDPDTGSSASVSLGQWGVQGKRGSSIATSVSVTPIRSDPAVTPSITSVDESRFITPYPTTMLGNRFQTLLLKCDFLAQRTNTSNVLQQIPVVANRYQEIAFQGGDHATTHLLNTGHTSISKINIGVSDANGNAMNFNRHDWGFTLVFSFVQVNMFPHAKQINPSAMLQAAKKRKLVQNITGQKQDPTPTELLGREINAPDEASRIVNLNY